ncbi:PLP-dependent transferase [Streptomyces sp. NPDC051985]|uniref:PLP-dependent transferase n=1 Tax=Streptomyces sp. NPDC051985 TaxID=3155807 RepID=UPI003436F725
MRSFRHSPRSRWTTSAFDGPWEGQPRRATAQSSSTPIAVSVPTARWRRPSTRPRGQDFCLRFGNPNHARVAAVVAEVEHTEAAMVTASGMAALTTAVLALVSVGRRLPRLPGHAPGPGRGRRDRRRSRRHGLGHGRGRRSGPRDRHPVTRRTGGVRMHVGRTGDRLKPSLRAFAQVSRVPQRRARRPRKDRATRGGEHAWRPETQPRPGTGGTVFGRR